MALITRTYSFGKDRCLICDKKLRKNRKLEDYCSIKCGKKAPFEIGKRLDKLAKRL